MITKGKKCKCKQPLPWHLFELVKLKHTCSCGRVYMSNAAGEVTEDLFEALKDSLRGDK